MTFDFERYVQQAVDWGVTSGWKVLLILILMLVGTKLSRRAANRLFSKRKREADPEFKKRADTLSNVISYVIDVTIILVGVVMILGQFNIRVGPILAAAGVVGVAIGFGAQHLVRDVISGFFILLDNQIRAGDVVVIAGKGGVVERVNLRMSVLRDLAGNVHYVRNGEISVVTNMTKDYSRYVFEIGVAYREDVDEVIEVVKQVDEELRSDPNFKDEILEPIEILGLDQFADSAIVIKARTKTKPIKQWSVGREFNRRLKKAFDEKDIEIPFPHVTLYMGQGKEGEAPPMNINMQGE
jgi:small conductance mechanosensitive channel